MSKKFFCRNCCGLRNQNVLFTKEIRSTEEDEIQFIDKYMVIECGGCETISFLNIYGDETMANYDDEGSVEYYDEIKIFPHFLIEGSELTYTYYLPKNIKEIYSETITCFKAGAYVLTAGGFRAIIEAICNNLKIKKTNLSARIDLLSQKGILTDKESKRLHSIRFVGNDALHEIEVPKPKQLFVVLEIINHILENLFIQDKKIKDRLDVIIDTYTEFISVLGNKIGKEMVGQEMTIQALLGKSIRLVKDTKTLDQFENTLKGEIALGKLDILTIKKEDNPTIYKIEKLPSFAFGL